MSSHPDTIWVSFRASRELKPPKIFQKGKKKKMSLKEGKLDLHQILARILNIRRE